MELKAFFNRAVVEEIGARIAANLPGFRRDDFVREIMTDLPALELKQRSLRIARGLRRHLPQDYRQALALLLASLGEDDGAGGIEGMGGFRHLPFLNFVSLHGLDEPELSLSALSAMTRHFSAEFDIRPFIERYPDLALARLEEWAAAEDWRLRRLASEGSRPRLPWGMRLTAFVADPSPVLRILEHLRADPHPVVRRSVANNLNDIAKDHPGIVLETARRWLATDRDECRAIVRHGLRSLIKAGDRTALALLGFAGGDAVVLRRFALSPSRIVLGKKLTIAFELVSRERRPVTLSIDYAVHHRRANGRLSPKVFKLARKTLAPGEAIRLERRHGFLPITTRRYYPGLHRVEILVNGRSLGRRDFVLLRDKRSA